VEKEPVTSVSPRCSIGGEKKPSEALRRTDESKAGKAEATELDHATVGKPVKKRSSRHTHDRISVGRKGQGENRGKARSTARTGGATVWYGGTKKQTAGKKKERQKSVETRQG